MFEEERHQILQRVAQGDLDPQDAARLLADLDTREQTHDADATPDEPAPTRSVDDDDWTPPPRTGSPAGALRGVRVVASATTVRVVGDPDVGEAVVEGPHNLRRVDDILVVECSPSKMFEFDFAGAFVTHGPRRSSGLRRGGSRQTTVRVNPTLALDLEVSAGHAVAEDVTGPIRCSVSAGAASLRQVTGPLQGSVSAGSLSMSGPLRTGESKISCDMGAVSVRLDDGADVRIRVRSALGKVAVDLPDDDGEYVVGKGTARLDIDANLGAVNVTRA